MAKACFSCSKICPRLKRGAIKSLYRRALAINILFNRIPMILKTFLLPAMIFVGGNMSAQNHPHLQKLWETDTIFKIPESAVIDAENQVIYVSNVNGSPWELDGNGFISKIDFSGNILNLKWVQGNLHGPKGMGISDRMLYVADIDAVVVIDLETGKIRKRLPADTGLGLNDIAVAPDGSVFVSGSNSNKIFGVGGIELELFKEDDFDRPNGLLAEDRRLLVLSSGSGKLYELDYNHREKKELAAGFGHGDGIASAGNGSYFLSDWEGKIYLLNHSGEVTKLLDTSAERINAADIDYRKENQMLVVPAFYGNKVVAYKLVK